MPRGREGRRGIHDAWGKRMTAYLGVTVNGFPNFFILLGPNTGLGHNSVVLMIEAQVRYTMNCLKLMKRKKQRVLEVRPQIQQSFVEEIYRRMSGTVWQSGGCRSWYQTRTPAKSPPLARFRHLVSPPHALRLPFRLPIIILMLRSRDSRSPWR